jgi:hypothetical protein
VKRAIARACALVSSGAFLGLLIRNVRWIERPDTAAMAWVGFAAVLTFLVWMAVIHEETGRKP